MTQPLFTLKIDGAAELEDALRSLGSDPLIRATLKKALLYALEPVARDARSRARRRTGRMAEGIDVSAQLSRRQKRPSNVGKDGAEAFVGASPIGPAILEEFGTAERHWKSGKSTGVQPAHPFMRPAWEAGRVRVLKDFSDMLWVAIEQAAARKAAKTAKFRSGA
jgi:GAF domain-containing protein